MGRLRKDKGEKFRTTDKFTDQPKTSGKQKSKARQLLKEQVLALGGDEQDYDLVKDVQDTGGGGDVEHDPALVKDVSKFLKGLNMDGAQVDAPTRAVEKQAERKKTARKDKPTVSPKPTPSKNPQSKYIIEPTSQWYTAHPQLLSSSTSAVPITPAKLASLTSHAASLHASTMALYQSSSSSSATSTSSDYSFLQKILQGGTLSDRLSALTLLVQSSPLHNVRALESLRGMAERGKGKGGREEGLKALRCIVDWWVGGGVPNRKLKYFRDQPLSNPGVTDQHLLLWYFEDWLKKYFFSILQVLETLSLDPLPYVRTQTLTLIFTLLRDKPEQEHNLLRLLVNKLGDTEKSICSRASYHLLQLVQAHPSMKSIIIREITSLVLRPATASVKSTGTRIQFDDSTPSSLPGPKKARDIGARYYATITCNQIVLSPGDEGAALQLIDVYFEIFKELLGEGKSEEIEAREEVEDEKEAGHGKGRDRHSEKYKGKTKAKEIKGGAGFAEVEDSHSRLISALLTGVNRALPFAKIGSVDVGFNKHIDTLFLITHTSTFNISLQALLLIQQISATLSSVSSSSSTKSSPLTASITDRYYRTLYASLHDPRLATSSKQAMYLNLLFKSLKVDANSERVKAFVKRFVQVLGCGGGGGNEFIAGGLYLLGELFNSIPGLRDMINPSLESQEGQYDPRKREPQFAHASLSPLWELIPLVHHYHPSVALHARQLLVSRPLTASADLSLNTLSHFLDRFVYKNPKKSSTVKGASAMQPAASANDGSGVRLMKGDAVVSSGVPVNEKKFWKRKAEDVPVDELFFHKFFSQKNEKEKAKAAKVDKRKDHDNKSLSDFDENGSQISSVDEAAGEDKAEDDSDDDPEEAEIWKVMQATMPKEAGDLMEDSDSEDRMPGMGDNGSREAEEMLDEEAAHSDALSLAEDSGNEDLLGLDDELPNGLIDYDASDSDEDGNEGEWQGVGGTINKRKRDDETRSHSRRKKLRSLPTFASYEDYAKLIDQGPEDDI